MNAFLNYLVEANLGLLMFLLLYKVLLCRETHFGFLRIILLTGIFASLLFPLIHVPNSASGTAFSIGQMLPAYWLPEVVIGGEGMKDLHAASFNFWKYTTVLYSTGLFCGFLIIVIQLGQLFTIIRRSATYRLERLRIAESAENKPTFSFFHFIFIGQADRLSSIEKQQIIRHESVHVRQWHSFDILLVNILKIMFWFNPFIRTYKNTFIQLHEFEADARAVENSDVNKYCSLLARVALQSANLSLANYFNNSLTIKRIEMMRTIKSKINRWKLVAVAAVIPGLFFFVACQEQIDEGIADIAQNSSMALLVPEKIQTKFDQLKNEHPDKKYVLLELNDAASSKLQKLEEDYGLPASISVYKSDDEHFEKTGEPTITGEASGVILNQLTSESSESIDRSAIHKDGVMNERERTFAIIEYNQQTRRIANASREGTVFTVVEEQPEFPGGFDEMKNFIKSNLKYPRESRMKGEEGTVYVSFIVETDGSISEVRTMRGISPLCDNEAMQVVKLFPKWVPGKQAGEVVRVKFVLPIRFQL